MTTATADREGDITISCAEDTDHDLTHDDCTGGYTRIAWESWPPREVHGICSCACHAVQRNSTETGV